jgi:hypothetical protein
LYIYWAVKIIRRSQEKNASRFETIEYICDEFFVIQHVLDNFTADRQIKSFTKFNPLIEQPSVLQAKGCTVRSGKFRAFPRQSQVPLIPTQTDSLISPKRSADREGT